MEFTVLFQGVKVPREEWYWPKAEADEDEDAPKEEEEDEEEIELTVSVSFRYLILFIGFNTLLRTEIHFAGKQTW